MTTWRIGNRSNINIMGGQLSWQSVGLKILASAVRFCLRPPKDQQMRNHFAARGCWDARTEGYSFYIFNRIQNKRLFNRESLLLQFIFLLIFLFDFPFRYILQIVVFSHFHRNELFFYSLFCFIKLNKKRRIV